MEVNVFYQTVRCNTLVRYELLSGQHLVQRPPYHRTHHHPDLVLAGVYILAVPDPDRSFRLAVADRHTYQLSWRSFGRFKESVAHTIDANMLIYFDLGPHA